MTVRNAGDVNVTLANCCDRSLVLATVKMRSVVWYSTSCAVPTDAVTVMGLVRPAAVAGVVMARVATVTSASNVPPDVVV